MIPGSTTKLSEEKIASAATIYPKTDVVFLTGTTGVSNIRPAFGGGFSGLLMVVSVDGAVAFATGGNIAKAATTVQNQVLTFVYSKARGLWYPGAL
jgi:hypothetical protein